MTKETGSRIGIDYETASIIQSLLRERVQKVEEQKTMQELLEVSRALAVKILAEHGNTTSEMTKGIKRTVRRTPEINITKDYPVDIEGTIHLEQEIGERPNEDDAQNRLAVVLKQEGKEPCNLFLLEPYQAFSLGDQLQTPAQLKGLRTVMTAIADAYSKLQLPNS